MIANFLIFQPIFNTSKTQAGLTSTFIFSNEKIKLPITQNHSLSPKFTRSCFRQDKVTFTPRNAVNLFIAYVLDACSRDLNTDFTLKDCYFGTVKLSKHVYPDKYSYSGCCIAFDSRSLLWYPGFDLEKRWLFLEQTIIHQCILIIIKSSPRSWWRYNTRIRGYHNNNRS